jgi:hypothetical protein
MGALLGKPTLILGLVVVGLIALAVVARNWSCRPVKPPRPPHTYTVSGTVASIESANRFTMTVGRRDRQTTIAYVVDLGTGLELTASLLPIGSPCSVECEGRRILGDAPEDAQDEAVEAVEGRSPLCGVVTGPTGADVGMALVVAGFCGVTVDSPAEYKRAASAAKKKGG